MVCDQALERIHAVHEAGYVSIFVFIFVITAIGLTTCFVQLLTLTGMCIGTSSPIIYS